MSENEIEKSDFCFVLFGIFFLKTDRNLLALAVSIFNITFAIGMDRTDFTWHIFTNANDMEKYSQRIKEEEAEREEGIARIDRENEEWYKKECEKNGQNIKT